MTDFPVTETKKEALRLKMQELKVSEKDLEEKFIKSSGPGGQKINKTDTCVVLTHKPTGISASSQRTRSQALNRFFARRLLLKKIEVKLLGKESAEQKKINRIRKNKKKQAKRARDKYGE